jgi:hypothetical protein
MSPEVTGVSVSLYTALLLVTGVNVTFYTLNPFSGYLLIFQTIMEKANALTYQMVSEL